VRFSSLSDAISSTLFLSKTPMQVSPARRAAFEILRRVEQEAAYASALLGALDQHLRADDRALCHELVLGVSRHRLWLDRVLEHFANRSVEEFDLPVKVALRIGLYQLRFLTRVPPSAGVNESVNLVRAARLKSAAALVNAVLRRATREPDYDPTTNVEDPAERLSIETSHPQWLIERWINSFGFDETAGLARANNQAAPVAFRLTVKACKRKESSRRILEELELSAGRTLPSGIAPGAWRLNENSTDPIGESVDARGLLHKLSREGLIYFQDEASQLVAQLLATEPHDRVLDVCAAPGSKTTLVAALAPEATIIAGDLHEHRIRTLRELAKIQAINGIRTIVHDATRALPFAEGSFDRVLVDAPCSGTGTLRRNPELRWRLTPRDITELQSKQKQILGNAAMMVRPGGLILYSTCAIETDENESVIASFVQSHSGFHPTPLLAASDLLTESGAVRTWPHRHDVDGFFVIGLRRG